MKKLIMIAVIWQMLNVSAYCHTGNRTASGVWPTAYVTCAADHLPFGSRVTLPNGTVVVIRDRMGGNYSDRLDLFKETEDECWKFGRKILRCKIETP